MDEGSLRSGREDAPITPVTRSPARVARAWSVHAFTALGAVFGLLALLAIAAGQWRTALLWMAATIAIDAVDGGLARWATVSHVLPGFDGALLDNIVDYVNYAVVPAFFLAFGPFLSPPYATLGGAAILLASAYQFGRVDAKTDDHFFTGFPSYWNAVVFYLHFLNAAPFVSAITVAVLAVLAFVPFRYVYPSRTPAFRSLTLVVTCAWGMACLVALALYPTRHTVPTWLSLLYVPYYLLVSVAAVRRVRGK